MFDWKTMRVVVSALAMCVQSGAWAQAWPSKAVTLIVPFGAGGPVDVVARAAQRSLQILWNQPYVVENRPGAGGLVGNDYVSRATPDGYTQLLNGDGVYTAKIFNKIVPYDPPSLRPLVELASANYIIVANPSVPARNLKEFVGYLKQKGAAANTGTVPNSSYELDAHRLYRLIQTDPTFVAYNSAVQTMAALLRNDIQFYFAAPGSLIGVVEGNRVTPIAVTGPRRNARWPAILTTREQGLDFDAGFSFGIWVPAATPDNVADKIGADVEKVLLSPQYGEQMVKLNFDVPVKPREYGSRTLLQVKELTEVAQAIGVKPQ